MDNGLLISSSSCSSTQASSSALSGTGQSQHRTHCRSFSAHFKDAVKNTDDKQTPLRSDAEDPIESVPATTVDDHATGTALIGIVVGSLSQVPNTHEAATPVDDKAESVPNRGPSPSPIPIPSLSPSSSLNSGPSPSLNPSPRPSPSSNLTPIPSPDLNQNPIGHNPESIESIPLLSQGLRVVAPPADGTLLGHEPMPADLPQPKTTDSPSASAPQPVLDSDQSSEVPATPIDSSTTNKPAIRNGRDIPAHLAPVPLEQPSDASALTDTRPPSPLISDQGAPPIMKNQGGTNLLPAAHGSGIVPSLARPSTDIHTSPIIQEHGDQETTLLSQSLSVRVIEDSGRGEQGSFGDLAQGAGSLFQFNASGTPESVMRGNQSPLFSDQFMLAQQTAPSPQGIGSPVVTSTADHLKLTQSLFSGDHSATMTSTPGIPQTIHVQLPSDDSGPLNVRISMTDQTVHTQFTTDRSDLGALLFMRQDQLQQTLVKSGLELGQFQVHVNQEGRQDALPDRQSRRHDGMPDQQPASQDHNSQTPDRERHNHRPLRALSLFA